MSEFILFFFLSCSIITYISQPYSIRKCVQILSLSLDSSINSLFFFWANVTFAYLFGVWFLLSCHRLVCFQDIIYTFVFVQFLESSLMFIITGGTIISQKLFPTNIWTSIVKVVPVFLIAIKTELCKFQQTTYISLLAFSFMLKLFALLTFSSKKIIFKKTNIMQFFVSLIRRW